MTASIERHALSLFAVLALLAVLIVQAVHGQNQKTVSSLQLARGFEKKVQKTARSASNRVVSIRPIKAGKRSPDGIVRRPSRSGGSGVIIHGSGYILTNDHVVEGVDSCEVIFHNGQRVPGAVWARDEVGDLALVKVKVNWPLPVAKFGDSQTVRVGQAVLAVGNALGLSLDNGEPAVTFGILSGTHRYQGGTRVYGDALQFDAAVNPGNSGGGLFDLEGRLRGAGASDQNWTERDDGWARHCSRLPRCSIPKGCRGARCYGRGLDEELPRRARGHSRDRCSPRDQRGGPRSLSAPSEPLERAESGAEASYQVSSRNGPEDRCRDSWATS
ncbi:MAG: trypsin-like peptidase domain-containing protein [Planctomycetota bacterium]|nr:trypsin-like peptidase domain-containing protein [Planctomycetota bacterium]